MEIYHQDGVLEIIIAAVLINFGFDILNKTSLTSLFTYIPILLLNSMKNQITISRIGYGAINADDKTVRNWNIYTAVGMVATLLAMGAALLLDVFHLRAAAVLPFGGDAGNLLVGAILALACLAGAYLIPLKRLNLYAVVIFAAGVSSFILKFNPAWLIFASGAGVLVVGIRMMRRFLRENTLPEVKP
jgi:hypothetical protein